MLDFAIDKISIHDLRRRIERLKASDLRKLSVEDLQQRVGIILNQIPLNSYNLVLTGVYRDRIRTVKHPAFTNTSELWYPPVGVTQMGRLNDVGQSVFYAANTPHTAMYEMRPAPGQIHTVMLARTKDGPASLTVAFLGVTQSSSADAEGAKLGLLRSKASLEKQLGPRNFKKYALLDQWLTEAITRVVPATEPELYKPTVGLANLLFNAPVDAINYPSVATGHRGLNLCFLREKADKYFIPSEVWEFEIVSAANFRGPGYVTRPLRKSTLIKGDGTIVWGGYGVDVGDFHLNNFARGELKSLNDP